jgi:hypothetical protein
MTTWKNAEANVRIAAGSIWGKEFKSTLVHGRQIDAYAVLDEKRCVAVEVTEVKNINKIQDDLNKLIHVRNTNFASGYVQTECVCVTTYEPTLPMRSAGQKINIDVISIEDWLGCGRRAHLSSSGILILVFRRAILSGTLQFKVLHGHPTTANPPRPLMGEKMRIEDCPAVASIEEIQSGQAFQFRHRDANYIGIKAFISAGSDRLPMVAVIWPSHSNRQNEPGVYDAAVLHGKSLIRLSDAAIVLSHDLDDTRLDDAVTGAAGGILLSDGNAPIMPVRGDKTRYLDLDTGELLDQPPSQISAQVAKWSLVRKVLGEFELIAEFKVAT